jgi:hypothetical protein
MTKPRALVLALGLSALACEKPVTYSYFKVTVTLDPITIDEDFIQRINSCGVVVEGPREVMADLTCTKGTVKRNLGVFDYSTAAKKGAVRFVVILKDVGQNVIARGESVELGIVPNVSTPATVLVKAVSMAGADAGADGGGADTAPSDGATDGASPDAMPVSDATGQ